MSLSDLSPDTLAALHGEQTTAYAELVAKGLKLDLTRGKPAAAQLDLSNELLTLPGEGDYRPPTAPTAATTAAVRDCRRSGRSSPSCSTCRSTNWSPATTRASAIMHDTWCSPCSRARRLGQAVGEGPVTFICPVPGYDRHFALCEQYGIAMVPVDRVRRRARPATRSSGGSPTDPQRQGHLGGADLRQPDRLGLHRGVTQELRLMPAAAPDFRIFWDNAYAVHHLTDTEEPALDVARAWRTPPGTRTGCSSTPPPPRSPSPGPAWLVLRQLAGEHRLVPEEPDQADDRAGQGQPAAARALPGQRRRRTRADAQAPVDHRAQVRAGRAILQARLGEHDVASWTRPEGGYFISLDVPDGLRRPGRRAGQGRRHRDDRRRGGFPVREGPPRPQHPDRPDLPLAGRRRRCDRGSVSPASCWPPPSGRWHCGPTAGGD